MAQSVERVLGKDEVTGSSPVSSSTGACTCTIFRLTKCRAVFYCRSKSKSKTIALNTRRDGHCLSRFFAYLCRGATQFLFHRNPTSRFFPCHNTLHTKNTARTPRTVLYFYLVLQICILHKALIHLTGNISALSDSPYYK